MNKTLEEYLNDLGKTPDEVAKTLLDKGCRGVPFKFNCCPVAQYIKRIFPGCNPMVRVEGASNGFGPMAEVPEPVAKFIIAFDKGDYLCLRS